MIIYDLILLIYIFLSKKIKYFMICIMLIFIFDCF